MRGPFSKGSKAAAASFSGSLLWGVRCGVQANSGPSRLPKAPCSTGDSRNSPSNGTRGSTLSPGHGDSCFMQ